MARVSYSSSSTLIDPSGYGCLAAFRVGGNGDPTGASTSDLSIGSGAQAADATVWVADVMDGFITDWFPVQFSAGRTSEAQFAVKDGTPLALNGTLPAAIKQVDICASVQTQAAMRWQNLTVTFYRNGQIVDHFDLAGPWGPDLSEAAEPQDCEQRITIYPDVPDSDGITVQANARMLASPGVQPTDDQIRSHIGVVLQSA